ncbi:uncharacterized protein METZ01_LOCUS273505 [marine metagenome]|uniref:DUF2846 domain-containing protein n=1 Tax=marine metagenome TaxID=408172 RepID=A0A382KD28_9ZZZZ
MVGMISLSNPLIAKHGPTEEEGIVYFIRPSNMLGAVNAVGVFDGDERLGKLRNNRAKYVMLEPGEYSLGDKKEKGKVELEVEANKAYYIRVRIRMTLTKYVTTIMAYNGYFDQVDEEDGEELLEDVKKVEEF